MASEAQINPILDRLTGPDRPGRVAVGVSGGPDSMALLHLLAQWSAARNIALHAFTVDHALRPESAAEAVKVAGWVTARWPDVRHTILRWYEGKQEARLLEAAREARYGLMAEAMRAEDITDLFIAHHQDDQAETFLIRLTKGSGLDGLAGMSAIQPRGDIKILRPLLGLSKAELIRICDDNSIPYVSDPTNENENYMRPRLRAARDILEAEGLTAKRLSVTAARIARARQALEMLSRKLFDDAVRERSESGFAFDINMLRASSEELVLRVILQAMDEIHPANDYGPRMDRVEALLTRILHENDFRGATLGRCIFAIEPAHATLCIRKEL